ncbi:hypothetical protein [Marinobacterium sp. BA1]|uniref:hypothetical protein n=1 Tax=Marinobacterium sp. BA1 TaxID=3138931 RepID=UPI0032E76374
MRIPLVALVFLTSAMAYAHTPVCRCELNGDRIDCEGGYHDGSSAVDETMRVIAYNGATLATGKLDTASRFSTPLPSQPFYILMDVGPGEAFEVDWRDIVGMSREHFSTTEAGDVIGSPLDKQSINELDKDIDE